MRILILLLLGLIVAQADYAQPKNYQQHSSVSNANFASATSMDDIKPSQISLQKAAKRMHAGWFSYAHTQMDPYRPTHGQSVGFLAIYPDSNLWATTEHGGHFNWWLHGIGISFDPSSPFFKHAHNRLGVKNSQHIGDLQQGYTLDSVHLVGSYVRKHEGIDTLYIELIEATDTNKYLLSKSATSSRSARSMPQHTISVANTPYVAATNSLKKGINYSCITKILDRSAANDTNAAGVHEWSLALPEPLQVHAGKKVVVYVHFASATQHPLGFKLDQANIWYQYSTHYNVQTALQKRDCNAGLYIHTRDRYALAGKTTIAGVPYLNVAHYIRRPNIAHYPLIALHIKQPEVAIDSAKLLAALQKQEVSTSHQEPKVNIKYKLKTARGSILQIYNKVGLCVVERQLSPGRQGVVSVPTSGLASGSYHYTIENKHEIIRGNVIIVH